MAVAYPRSTPAASVAGAIDPLQPPLPLASYFLFQPEAGSHSSTWMSESEDGLMVIWTRQNAGRLAKGFPPFPFFPAAAAWVNSPAPTDAAVMVVSGKASEERLSQVAPNASEVQND